ncbi:MAG TPA: hypothetical protein VFK38_10150 [Candidatus Limnocylindrales bacterium]|nr:hypothetical protein [Candidatus Limnocylindrales bacterium]
MYAASSHRSRRARRAPTVAAWLLLGLLALAVLVVSAHVVGPILDPSPEQLLGPTRWGNGGA